MRITLDTEKKELFCDDVGEQRAVGLYTSAAFDILTRQWLKLCWNQKSTYTFTWLGRPIIQLPEDMFRIQEVIHSVRPDVIIETGIAHGGSLVFYAGLCKILGQGRVIGIDIDIRAHNRQALEAHPLFPWITLLEGDSVSPDVVARVRSLVMPGEKGLVMLDSGHSKSHVLAELEAYHEFVSAGSYIVASDGIMRDLRDVPRGKPEWAWDNPASAAEEFAKAHPEFVAEEPRWLFNESTLETNITHWQGGWLRRK